MTLKRHTTILIGGLTLIALACADLFAGGGGFSPAEGIIFWRLRVPRVLTALLAGASLAAGGTQMQGIFRNPLADPHILGISGGAGLGAALATLTGTGSTVGLTAAAFAGALLTGLLVILIARRISAPGPLLIFGVMLGFIFSALVSLLQYAANEESLKRYYSWAAGSFSGLTYPEVILIGIALCIGFTLAMIRHKGLDLLLFGESFTALSGADGRRIRLDAIISCSLMTAAVTAFCGPIGFIGIIAPQLAGRLLGTSRHRILLPCALVTGGVIALLADLLSNLSPVLLPVGSTVALLGIPVILVLLIQKAPTRKI